MLMLFERQVPASGETSQTQAPLSPRSALSRSFQEIRSYVFDVARVFFMTRRGFLGLLIAMLPFGGMALSIVVSTVITPTLGMRDNEIATLGLVCSLVFCVCCVAGGYFSDRFGRRTTLSLFALGTLLPTLWMGWQLELAGWEFATEALEDGSWPRHDKLILAWWIAGLAYSVFHGLMYGVRTAFFMDIVEPRIAATQFTAYMALINVVTIYSYWWEGRAITSIDQGGWGLTYLQIFCIDAALGALFLLLIPFVKPRNSSST
jgi:PAT family beta-lactamase induction signal transducer AmpG